MRRPASEVTRRILFRPVLRQFGGRLRYVAVGGAAMNPNLARRWEEMGVQVLQGYGATEASPVICFTRREHNRIGTVGQAIPGVEIRIADDGEVLVSGPGIFAGYWQKPDATTAVLTVPSRRARPCRLEPREHVRPDEFGSAPSPR